MPPRLRLSPRNAEPLTVPVGPGDVHVERYGFGGPPVVLLHGFGTSSFVWRNVAPALARAGTTAYAVDLLGYGQSDRPFDADFGIAGQAGYLERLVTRLEIAPATVVGLDLGGAIALRLAALHPTLVSKLVLVNPIAFEDVPADDIKTMQTNTARFAFRVSRGLLGAAPLLDELLRRGVTVPERMPDALVAAYLAPYVGEEGVNHLLALGRAVDADDLDGLELRRLPQAALIVWGDRDPWVGPRMADRLEEALPGGRLVRLPGVSRLVPEEAPETLIRLILEFVGQAGQPQRTAPLSNA
ncbi:MAG TPA: alpha/beta hydrolase [Gemmatimonadaceae bacterium]|nr:alpha/beta hydrolase [Gemmatimonadaceae bacterium]